MTSLPLPVLRGPAYLASPRISAVAVSSVPYKSRAIQFAPVTASQIADTERLFALASHSHTEHANHCALFALNTDISDSGSEPLSHALGSISLAGNVNDLVWLNASILVSVTSKGTVHVVAVSAQSPSSQYYDLSLTQSITDSAVSLNSVASNSQGLNQFAICSDSGSLALYDSATLSSIRRIDRAATGAIYTSQFAGSSTLYTAGMNGTVNVFDTRSNDRRPSNTVKDTHSHDILSLSVHPARLDTMATGASNGTLATFDLRMSDEPLFVMEHRANTMINDIVFLPFDPSTVMVCDESGALTAYDFNSEQRDTSLVRFDGRNASDSEDSQRSLPATVTVHQSPMALNIVAVDRSSHTIVSAGDALQLVHFQYSLT